MRIDNLLSFFTPNASEKNKVKVDLSELLDKPESQTTKYRIKDEKLDETYQRDKLLPPLEDSEIVLQATYAKAGKDTGKRYIESIGAGPCVIVTLYNSENKTGYMIHFDSRSNVITTLRDIYKEMNTKTGWEMRIFGGHKNKNSSIKIIDEVKANNDAFSFRLVEEDILQDSFEREVVNLVMDTETGNVFDLPEKIAERYAPHLAKIERVIDGIENDLLTLIGKVHFIHHILD